MPDYQKSKIYKLYSPSKNLVYYGSTIQTISQRLNEHISRHKKYNNDNNYCAFVRSFLILDCEDYKIELVEEYECNNKQQLLKKEAEYIKNNECVNKEIPLRTRTEWRIDNPDKEKAQQKRDYEKAKEYRTQHKSEYNEKMRAYRKANGNRINEMRRLNKLKKAEIK
jgi:hypothetical protein